MEYLRVECTYVHHMCVGEESSYSADWEEVEGEVMFPAIQPQYKDTVFRMLFKEKPALLSLYNAVNGTDFTNVEDLEVTTLENAIYLGMKNDVSFVFAFELNLYEHQSTINPNMPLRNLFYVARQLQKIVPREKLYGSKTIKIPAPRFVVFYNGKAAMPERVEYRLSDLFEKKVDDPELELCVTAYNINPGMNEDLLEGCRLLKEYMLFVEKVRKYDGVFRSEKAFNQAVDECIREGILADFLEAQRAEVVAMCLHEYDQQEFMQILIAEGRETGWAEGHAAGHAEGHAAGHAEALLEVYHNLLNSGMTRKEVLSVLQITEEELEALSQGKVSKMDAIK